MAGAGGVVFELASQLGHVLAQIVGLGFVLRSPHLLQQMALADEFARVARKDLSRCHSVGVSRACAALGGGDGAGGDVHGVPADRDSGGGAAGGVRGG